jgi:hypothetical protein
MSISRSLNRIFDKGRDERREPPVPTTSIADKLKSSEEPPKAPTPAPRFAPKGSDTGGGFEGEPSTTVQPTVSIPKPTEPAPVSVAPAITQTQQILQREGFTSAEDARQQILKREFKRRGIKEDQALTAQSILSDLGIESAQDILDIEEQRKQEKIAEAERKRALQVEEQEFARKQQEYIDNLDPNNFKLPGQNTYETKFGELDFDQSEFAKGRDNFSYNVKVTDQDLVFVPQEFVYKGATFDRFLSAKKNKEGKYERYEGPVSVWNKDFLNLDHLTGFLKSSQLVDLENNKTKYKDIDLGANKSYNKDNLNIGYLLTKEDYNKYFNPRSFQYTFKSNQMHEGAIKGLTFDSTKNRLIYVAESNVRADQSQAYWYLDDKNGVQGWTEWYNKPSGFFGIFKGVPILGDIDKALLDVTEFFAEIPLAPEIAAILIPGDPGSKAAIYAGLKGLQARGMGGDAEDVLKAAGIAYATSSIKLDKLGEKVGASLGIEDAVVGKAVGTALTYSAFNGIMAAATGGDVADAMLSGAIMGGLSQSGAEVTNKIFGAGDSVKGAQNVAKLADQLNLKPQQFQKIFMNSTISASISASRGGDFFKQFTNSAIAQGISTASANKMKTALEGAGMSEQNVKALTRATYNLVNAAAYSAIRGTSVEDALKVVAQKEVQRQVAGRLKAAYEERKKVT